MGNHSDSEKEEPNLELPSLFRRRRRNPAPETPATAAETDALPAPSAEAAPVQADPGPEQEPEPHSDTPTDGASVARQPRRRARRSRRPRRTLPSPRPRAAAAVVGLVVGAAGTTLTWASLRGCEMLRGTESCGGPGLLALLAILALMVLVGAVGLKVLSVSEASATSFLGVGLMTVVVLVALMEKLFSPWMFVVVPLLCAVAFPVAQWVSTRFVETDEAAPPVDVR